MKLAHLVFVFTAALVGCNGILGIEEATVDLNVGRDAGGAASDAGSDSAAPPTDTCQLYCGKMQRNCVQTNEQYISEAVCLAMCPKFESGSQGATEGNNLACRISHADLAATDPATHCPHAGPIGFGTCGASCDGFCLLTMSLCRTTSPAPYTDEQDCRAKCTAGANGPFKFTPGTAIGFTTSGNTLNCRVYHLESAYDTRAGAKEEHCPHTGVISSTCF